MLTPHSSWPFGRLTHFCSTIDQIIDEAALASQGRLSKNGAIIDQSTDLVAWAEEQVTLRLSARIDADRLVAEIEQLA
jgi:hypothetical protein